LLLTIEKLTYGGDGLARLRPDDRGRGKAVFIPFVLAGEKIEACLTEEKAGFARAKAEAVIDASPHRVQPRCPYFVRCGGCHYQHASYEHQLEIKTDILRENFRRIAKRELKSEIGVHPSPPRNYRNRSRLQIRTQPEFAAGYFKLGGHEVLPVEQCPISSPLINRGIAALWQISRAGKTPEGLREAEFFANADDKQLLVELACTPETPESSLKNWAEGLRTVLPEIVGIVAFREAKPREKSASAAERLFGTDYLTYQTQRFAYRVSAGSFFQTNRNLTDELVNIVTQEASGDLALDLYAGVGLFSTALARSFRRVVSVEPSHRALPDLQYNLPPNGEAVKATTEQYLSQHSDKGQAAGRIVSGKQKPDLVVVDPPRRGLGEPLARSLADVAAARLIYVSCDPATLARDLVPLLTAGYRVEQAHVIDLFPQTYHLESIVKLVR
jgi:23S rRNA (uracil1939-C5)-methyltransferase